MVFFFEKHLSHGDEGRHVPGGLKMRCVLVATAHSDALRAPAAAHVARVSVLAAMLVALVDGFSPAPLRAALGGRRQTACGRAPPVMMATKKPKKAPSTAKGFAAMPKSIGKYELTTDADVAAFMQWLRDGGAVIGKVACADDLRGIKGILKSSLYSACVCAHTGDRIFF
jgi:hypothetical protein